MSKRLISTTAVLALLTATGAQAATMAKATTDLNVRSGPGAWHEVVGVIDADADASVEECYTEANWCKVSYNGVDGWAYGEYLVVGEETPIAVVAPEVVEDEAVKITRIEATVEDTRDESALAGAGWGAVAGALIAGPAGAAVGAAVSSAAAYEADVGPQLVAYIEQNPVDPVYLDGELVVGAAVPDSVVIHELPEEDDFAYLNVNGVPVVVDSDSRKIVTIVE